MTQNHISVIISVIPCGAQILLAKITTKLKTHGMGEAATPELGDLTTETLIKIEVCCDILREMNDHNTLFHVLKAIMKSGCVWDCLLQTIPFIYSMKLYCIILHFGILRMNSAALFPFGPTNRTIFLPIYYIPCAEVKKGKSTQRDWNIYAVEKRVVENHKP